MAKKRKPTPKPEEEEEYDEEEDDDSEEEEDDDSEAEEEEDSSSRESIRKLLEPFGKDQLIDLLKDSALKDPALLSRIAGTPAPSDPTLRKIFVHGLGWDATTEDLTAVFAPFGEIEDCRAVADRNTGRCKGYGFVLFRTPAAARKALKEPQKKVGLRTTSCQLAFLGPPASANQPGAMMGMNPMVGLMGPSLNPAPAFTGYSAGISPSLNRTGTAFSGYSAGMSPYLNRTGVTPPPYGYGLGFGGGGPEVNSASPSGIGRYGSPVALQELGTYQTGLYSSGTAMRYQSGVGSMGSSLPPYLGRY